MAKGILLAACVGVLGCGRDAEEVKAPQDDEIVVKSAGLIPVADSVSAPQKPMEKPKTAMAEVVADDAANRELAVRRREQQDFRRKITEQERNQRQRREKLKEMLDGIPPNPNVNSRK